MGVFGSVVAGVALAVLVAVLVLNWSRLRRWDRKVWGRTGIWLTGWLTLLAVWLLWGWWMLAVYPGFVPAGTKAHEFVEYAVTVITFILSFFSAVIVIMSIVKRPGRRNPFKK